MRGNVRWTGRAAQIAARLQETPHEAHDVRGARRRRRRAAGDLAEVGLKIGVNLSDALLKRAESLPHLADRGLEELADGPHVPNKLLPIGNNLLDID